MQDDAFLCTKTRRIVLFATVTPDTPGMDQDTLGFANPDTPEKHPKTPEMTRKLRPVNSELAAGIPTMFWGGVCF